MTKEECQHEWAGKIDIYKKANKLKKGAMLICAKCGAITYAI